MRVLKEQVSFCAAAPKVIEDLSVARSQPPDVAIRLLRFRAKRMSELGRDLELVATAETLCVFEEGDSEEQYHLAAARDVAPYLENGRSTRLKGGDRLDLHRRCKDRAVAALARAIESGPSDPNRVADDSELDSIRDHPGFAALLERARSRQTPREVR